MSKRVCLSSINSRVIFGCILLLGVTLVVACEPRPSEIPLEEVRVQLAWKHQAQFAGLYAAEQNGYYTKEGIEVNFIPRPGPAYDVIEPLVDGAADFSINSGVGVLTARSEGAPIVAITAIYRRYPLAFMAMDGSGILQPDDFPGHSMRTTSPGGSTVVFNALMARFDLDPTSVIQIDAGFDLSPFYNGELDIWPAFITNEVIAARAEGYEVNLILPDDYGVHLYGDILFTTEMMIVKNPDLVFRFLRATLKGWRWAIENPKEAGLMTLEYNSELNGDLQVAQMEASIPFIHTGDNQIGWMRAEIWENMYVILEEQGLLDASYNVEDVYTMEFLERMYGEEP